jgi:hypothetical protein
MLGRRPTDLGVKNYISIFKLENIMKIIFILLVFLSSFSISCASISNSNLAHQYSSDGKLLKNDKTKLGLKITAEEDSEMSSKYFGLIDMTFENDTEKWIRINNVSLDFGSEEINKAVKIVSGQDIIAWKDAMQKLKEINDYNKSLVLGTIAVLGATSAMTSSNQNVKAIGAFSGIGALTALTVDEYNKNLSRIENTKIFPQNHLMAEDLNIPPGLFAKKWILLNSSNHKKIGIIDYFNMTYVTESGEKEIVRVDFRYKGDRYSEWQNE